MSFPFSKYTGLGNDFIFFDNRETHLELDSKTIQKLCHRRLGIGADGIVLLEESVLADFKMRIFNADGYEAEMCGNALRAFYLFLLEKGYPEKEYLIETFERQLKIFKKEDLIVCEMGEVKNLQLNQTIKLSQGHITGHFLNTGVPHFVVFSDDLDHLDVKTLGREISHHAYFSPKRTNVNFVSILNSNQIQIRTFERGVEDETLACGTGAAASAIAAHLKHNLISPIFVQTALKKNLKFTFDACQNQILNLKMHGEAQFVFHGDIQLEMHKLKL